jgi:hypothetical protein
MVLILFLRHSRCESWVHLHGASSWRHHISILGLAVSATPIHISPDTVELEALQNTCTHCSVDVCWLFSVGLHDADDVPGYGLIEHSNRGTGWGFFFSLNIYLLK